MKYFCLFSVHGREDCVGILWKKDIVVSILSPLNWFWSCGKRRNCNLWFISHRLFSLWLAKQRKTLDHYRVFSVQVHLNLKWKMGMCFYIHVNCLSFLFFLHSLILPRIFFGWNYLKLPILNGIGNTFGSCWNGNIHFFGNEIPQRNVPLFTSNVER